ncbi:twin-arginine translocase TatA/TatE family subunit [Skermanella mucosa]|uniref:twin-arginine translocase TatA/TatE family subunit n=1 Tax=Skermanella mucosa TaxID=1789672 RepID=UPI00192C195B|nr:twin-arginine translocase TatA/TatE family subunit [Skermanella mucosa]UEM18771.1 twin-arginine translocase TatA/TatE family subunit [Skermanella mucosa]
MSIGIWQVVLILVIVLIIFGAGKLPKVMGDVAKGVKNFKSGLKEDDDDGVADQPRVIDSHATTQPVQTSVHAAPGQPASPVPAAGTPTVDHTTTVRKDETAKT